MQNIEVSEKSGYIMVTNVDYVSATLLAQSRFLMGDHWDCKKSKV